METVDSLIASFDQGFGSTCLHRLLVITQVCEDVPELYLEVAEVYLRSLLPTHTVGEGPICLLIFCYLILIVHHHVILYGRVYGCLRHLVL
jgi:hypothetical protein